MPTTAAEPINPSVAACLAHPAALIDHTLLGAIAQPEQIAALCEEAVEYGFAAVCIPPLFVPLAVASLYGSEVAVATVVGFPFGYETTAIKVEQTRLAVATGASEIDMVIQQGAAFAGDFAAVEADICAVVRAAGPAQVKVILECCRFDSATKLALTAAVLRAGAASVKTSTGYADSGATVADVCLLSEAANGRIGVKAAGGIRDWAFCRQLIEAGATRIGTSAGVHIMEQWRLAQS
jgi:deoxyribose-phosphate aldolase